MSTNLANQRFGAHLSIAGGMHKALLTGVELGCQCAQVFTKNQRQWRATSLTDEHVRQWRKLARQTKIRPVVAHDSYLINLASPDAQLWARSVDAFVGELCRCEKLNIRWLVTHPGCHTGDGERPGLQRVVRALNKIHARLPDCTVKTLLETTAGQGSSLGYRFEHLAYVLEHVGDPSRIDICLDTAHVFAAGYDIATRKGYETTMRELDRLIGIRRVRCVHTNDSARPLGSRVDRHAHIGDGHIGLAGFRNLVNDRRLARVPKILETPKHRDRKGRHYDTINMERLRRLITDGST